MGTKAVEAIKKDRLIISEMDKQKNILNAGLQGRDR